MLNLREWDTRLKEAHTNEDVLWVVRDFLSHWTPQQLSELPEGCRPGRIEDPDDVAEYALILVWKRCHSDFFPVPRLHAMTSFFAAASQRLSQIAAFTAHFRSTLSTADNQQ